MRRALEASGATDCWSLTASARAAHAGLPRLSRLELRIMDVLWTRGSTSVREVQEALPRDPAYTTVQTTMYRLEAKGILRRAGKIGNAHVFEPVVSRAAAQRRLIDDLLSVFGGRSQPIVAQLIDAGKLTLDDLREAEALLRERGEEGPT